MLLAFYTMFFFLLACYTCVVFCMHLFLHLSVSAFLLFRISVFLHFYMSIPPYPLHLLCISAFLHFCIARLLQFWICSRMLRCVYFCISMSFCRDLSESVGVNRLESVGGVLAGIAKRNNKRLVASDVPRSFSLLWSNTFAEGPKSSTLTDDQSC